MVEELVLLAPTVLAAWSVMAVAAVGVAALPWTDDEVTASAAAWRLVCTRWASRA